MTEWSNRSEPEKSGIVVRFSIDFGSLDCKLFLKELTQNRCQKNVVLELTWIALFHFNLKSEHFDRILHISKNPIQCKI